MASSSELLRSTPVGFITSPKTHMRPSRAGCCTAEALANSTNRIRGNKQVKPPQSFSLGAQSLMAGSFESPEYIANSDALGTLLILGAIAEPRTHQASTSDF
jgi:GDP-D-mannose dehydratase